MAVTLFIVDSVDGIQVSENLEFLDRVSSASFVWLDIESTEEALLTLVGGHFGLHELAIEDCLTPGHQPKIEDYGSHLQVILRTLRPISALDALFEEEEDDEGKGGKSSTSEEASHLTRKVALFISDKFLVTFRRHEVAWLDAIVRQIRQSPEEFVASGVDALVHRISDVLVDRFLRGMNFFERVIDGLEDTAVESPDDFDLAQVFELKHELSSLRQVAREQRSVIARLPHEGARFIQRSRRRYFKDLHDHAVMIVSSLDKQLDALIGIRDAYAAFANVRLGDTMRVLTVITTIAAPLNIIVGLYGMNFQSMPFLDSRSGFYVTVGFMFALSILMLWVFRRMRWL